MNSRHYIESLKRTDHDTSNITPYPQKGKHSCEIGTSSSPIEECFPWWRPTLGTPLMVVIHKASHVNSHSSEVSSSCNWWEWTILKKTKPYSTKIGANVSFF